MLVVTLTALTVSGGTAGAAGAAGLAGGGTFPTWAPAVPGARPRRGEQRDGRDGPEGAEEPFDALAGQASLQALRIRQSRESHCLIAINFPSGFGPAGERRILSSGAWAGAFDRRFPGPARFSRTIAPPMNTEDRQPRQGRVRRRCRLRQPGGVATARFAPKPHRRAGIWAMRATALFNLLLARHS